MWVWKCDPEIKTWTHLCTPMLVGLLAILQSINNIQGSVF